MLFALSGLSAFAAIPSRPAHGELLPWIAIADLAVALVAWVLPWDRWRPELTALLALPGFAVLGLSTWAFGEFAAGTGPFFVLLFAWLGLHERAWIVVVAAVPATAAYIAPLVAADSPPELMFSAFALIPVGVGIGLVIARQVSQLREERDRARQAESWRSALMATLAHDIRSPLTTVQGTLMVLDDMPTLSPERRAPLLRAALRQTKRLTSLATGLLDLDRVEQGKLRLDRRWTLVAETADHAVASVPTDADIRVEIPPDLRVHADPDRLEQVLINLTANAVRHGRPPVVISAASERPHRPDLGARPRHRRP